MPLPLLFETTNLIIFNQQSFILIMQFSFMIYYIYLLSVKIRWTVSPSDVVFKVRLYYISSF